MKILVPTDFSDTSLNANVYATAIAQQIGAELILFHAYHFPVTDPMSPAYGTGSNVEHATDLMEEYERNIKNQMINLCSDVRSKTDNKLACDFVFKPGFLVDQILEVTEDMKCGLIVMGTKGSSGIKDSIFGSNTASVLEKADCPVLAVPKGARLDPLKKIIYATDYHETDIDKINEVVKIFGAVDPEIHVVHVIADKENDTTREGFQKRLQNDCDYKKLHYHVFENDDVMDGIEEAVKKLDADMVAITTRKKGFLKGLFSKSITKKMVYHAEIPLLAIHE